MAHSAEAFMNAVAKQTSRLPLWYPGTDIDLGDIGVIEDGGWVKKSSFSRLGIAFETDEDETPDQLLQLGAGEVRQVDLNTGAEVDPKNLPLGNVKVGVGLSFNSDGQFYLQAKNILTHKIGNLHEVEQAALDAAKDKSKWVKGWIFVSEIMTADRSIIAVSKKAGASVAFDLGLDATTPVLDLGSAKADAKIAKQDSMEAVSLSMAPKVLTYGARKVYKGWWWTKEVGPVERWLDEHPVADVDLGDVLNSVDVNPPSQEGAADASR